MYNYNIGKIIHLKEKFEMDVKKVDLTKDVLIVGQKYQVSAITTDKVVAEKILIAKKKQYPNLNWGIRTIKEAIEVAYNAGREDTLKNYESKINKKRNTDLQILTIELNKISKRISKIPEFDDDPPFGL